LLSAALWSCELDWLRAREEATAPRVAARAAAKRRVQRTRRNGPEVDLLFVFIGFRSFSGIADKAQDKPSGRTRFSRILSEFNRETIRRGGK